MYSAEAALKQRCSSPLIVAESELLSGKCLRDLNLGKKMTIFFSDDENRRVPGQKFCMLWLNFSKPRDFTR